MKVLAASVIFLVPLSVSFFRDTGVEVARWEGERLRRRFLLDLCSPSAFSRRAVVSYWRKYVHEVLVNRLGGLSLPRKSVVRLTDRPDMTLDVYRGRKTTIQQLDLCSQCVSPEMHQ